MRHSGDMTDPMNSPLLTRVTKILDDPEAMRSLAFAADREAWSDDPESELVDTPEKKRSLETARSVMEMLIGMSFDPKLDCNADAVRHAAFADQLRAAALSGDVDHRALAVEAIARSFDLAEDPVCSRLALTDALAHALLASGPTPIPTGAIPGVEGVLNAIQEGIVELELHDDTGDPHDEGYRQALSDVRKVVSRIWRSLAATEYQIIAGDGQELSGWIAVARPEDPLRALEGWRAGAGGPECVVRVRQVSAAQVLAA